MERRPKTRLLVTSALAAVLLAAATPSDAYRLTGSSGPVDCNASAGFTHWNVRNLSFRHNTAGQGAGKQTALQSAMQSWTDVPIANHRLIYAGTTSTAPFINDGVNVVAWGFSGICQFPCLAVTVIWFTGTQAIVDADVLFNSQVIWNTDTTDYDTQAVAAHELGHSLGIAHTEVTTSPTPTMFASYFGTPGRTLENDDRAALQCSDAIYPAIDCAQDPRWTCTPCCGSVNCSCTEVRACRNGMFDAWSDYAPSAIPPRLKRTGIRACATTHTSRFIVQHGTSTGTVTIPARTCVNLHLDELAWSPSKPTFPDLTAVSFSVVDVAFPFSPRTAKVITSRTADATNYNIYRITSCTP